MDFPAFLKSATHEQLSEALPTLQQRLNQALNNHDHGLALCFAAPLTDVLREIEDRKKTNPRKR